MEEEQEKLLLHSYPHYWGFTPEEDYYKQQGITSTTSFFTTPLGLKLFTRSWLPNPSSTPPRALIFMLHGYSWTICVTAPNPVLHGSRELYREARSEDKTIRVYEGMMHLLLFGETDENVEIVRNDILEWLLARCTQTRVE
ncbi:hypothetical protein JHK82_019207 [Glycine max]|uniref:Caffeoylshikimate esterase n=1 Tax=Glycine soja TaxID=3848 RepID=A0A445JYV6_GLYSO|nr:hypothetical protein JHK85_019646 [Glycine max]KAG5038386.1 hypothetical protein JHK86_019226 [Glycine max]KAG5143512.1 hypothetical protein JHK82_019207 [Glycine max]KAH1242929.1 Caffeoylshikimate esterase [Glycine max]RZC03659.1 hypothetical protein D0Y65_018355 [Glycine soja]